MAIGTTVDHLRPGWIAVALEDGSIEDVAARSVVVAGALAWNAEVVGTSPMTRVVVVGSTGKWTPTGSRPDRDRIGRVASAESEVAAAVLGHRVDGPRPGRSLASGTGIAAVGGGLVRRHR